MDSKLAYCCGPDKLLYSWLYLTTCLWLPNSYHPEVNWHLCPDCAHVLCGVFQTAVVLEVHSRHTQNKRNNTNGEKNIKCPPPPHFCVMRFWGHFLRENVNLMYFVRVVVIESLVVIRYRVYFCTWSREFLIFQAWIRETSLRRDAFLDHFCVNMLAR